MRQTIIIFFFIFVLCSTVENANIISIFPCIRIVLPCIRIVLGQLFIVLRRNIASKTNSIIIICALFSSRTLVALVFKYADTYIGWKLFEFWSIVIFEQLDTWVEIGWQYVSLPSSWLQYFLSSAVCRQTIGYCCSSDIIWWKLWKNKKKSKEYAISTSRDSHATRIIFKCMKITCSGSRKWTEEWMDKLEGLLDLLFVLEGSVGN